MKTMRAQVVEAPGRMALRQVEIPRIAGDEVLIRVKMCGICGTDWKIYTGQYASQYLPMIAGHEFWGEIETLGDNVTGLAVGQRVSVDICMPCGHCYFCRRNEYLLCKSFTQLGIHTDGAYAEYVKAPARNCYPIPDGVDDYSAAFIEPLTAVLEASKRMNCTIGSSVVIIGSGLGILHGALAKLRGAAPVIIVDKNPKRLEMALSMGADIAIDINKTPDAVAEVMRITNGVGADYVLEAVGTPQTYEQAFAMVRRGGKVEAFGVVPEGQTAQLQPYEFVLGEKKVSGSCAGIGNDWGDALTLLQYKRIDPRPLFSMVVPLEDLENALKELRTNPNLIKVFVSPEIKERKLLHLPLA